MDPLMTDLKALIDERNERFEDAGLLPRRNPRRTSFEVLRDVRRRRAENRSAA